MAWLGLIAGCGCASHEPGSTIATIEVPVPTVRERADLLNILEEFSSHHRLRMYAKAEQELAHQKSRLPDAAYSTVNVGIWRHASNSHDDLEVSVSDLGQPGRARIAIIRHGQTDLPQEAREALIRTLIERWPAAALAETDVRDPGS
ncbi:hypothetical protein [Phenylobacterium sp. CCH12-B4]|uniref:hypothetical protein n=1 Tax=Phenylobacterium sp. CCH12-B4 TaxID=1768784 RepID=UPI0018D24F5D|nr:hypothetical protein [Phenylobacterium sp. CCH12-B4]